jgi:hypothetical protein
MSVNDVHNLFISIGIPDDWEIKILDNSLIICQKNYSIIFRVFKPAFKDNWVLQIDNDNIDIEENYYLLEVIMKNYIEYLTIRNELNNKWIYLRKILNKDVSTIRDIKINKALK